MDIASSIASWFVNPIVKDYFISPILGAVVGVLFNAFLSGKDGDSGGGMVARLPPRTVHEARVVYVRVQERGAAESGGELAAAVLFFCGLVYAYAAHARTLIEAGLNLAYCSVAFSVVFAVFAFWRGRIAGKQWALVFSYSAVLAVAAVVPLVMAINRVPLWFEKRIAVRGLIKFYFQDLDVYGQKYVATQSLGVFCIFVVLLWSFGWALHYIALLNNYAANGNRVWAFVVRSTRFLGGWSGIFFSSMLFMMSYFLIEGTILDVWNSLPGINE